MDTGKNNINSSVWIQVVKNSDTGETLIMQGPEVTFTEAFGLLEYARLTYESKYKIQMELENIEGMKEMFNGIAKSVGQAVQSAKVIESSVIRTAGIATNIQKGTEKK